MAETKFVYEVPVYLDGMTGEFKVVTQKYLDELVEKSRKYHNLVKILKNELGIGNV